MNFLVRRDHRDDGFERGGQRQRSADSRSRLAQYELIAAGTAGWGAHAHPKHQSTGVIPLSSFSSLSRRSSFSVGLGLSVDLRNTHDVEAYHISFPSHRLARWQVRQVAHHAVAVWASNLRKQGADGSLSEISAERRKTRSERGGGCACLVSCARRLVAANGGPAAFIAHKRPGFRLGAIRIGIVLILPSGLERQYCNPLSRAQHAELNASHEQSLEDHRICVRLALGWSRQTAQPL